VFVSSLKDIKKFSNFGKGKIKNNHATFVVYSPLSYFSTFKYKACFKRRKAHAVYGMDA
jgi:hypothetical protein